MFSLRPLARQRLAQFAVALVTAGSWLSGCGDDSDGGGDDGKGGNGGSGAMAGSAGSATGGTTGGSGGSPSGGSGGMPTGGTGGASAGTAGMGGEGLGGDDGMGGEGGVGVGGEGGVGVGGEGGSTDALCASANLSFTQVSANPMQQHDHLPIAGAARTTLLAMINTGMPLVFTLPEEGQNTHTHTLTFTAQQLTILRNGGALGMNITSSMGGPQGNQHTHTYAIECAP